MERYMVYDDRGKFLGSWATAEQAATVAKGAALRSGTFAEVEQILITEEAATQRRNRYHADGRMVRLWKERERVS